jgi:DNA-binding CsgD family transcriptional regulator
VLDTAASLVDEIQVATEATGIRLAPYGALGLAAFQGRGAEGAALASATKEEAAVRGEGAGISVADWATAVLSNGTHPPRVAGHRGNSAQAYRGAHTDLTAQEAQIAKLARDGHTNQEIAAQLYISPRTVEWHLGNVSTKLGIISRKDLR